MVWAIIGYVAFSLVAWFSWMLIHEFSHLAAAKLVRPILSWKIYPFPHMHEGNWYWARITWIYQMPEMSEWELFFVKFAPRIPDMISGIMFMLLSLFSGPLMFLWIIFWGFGLIDLAVGSMGLNPTTDLQTASKAVNWNPWILRISGFAYVLMCALVGLLLLL